MTIKQKKHPEGKSSKKKGVLFYILLVFALLLLVMIIIPFVIKSPKIKEMGKTAESEEVVRIDELNLPSDPQEVEELYKTISEVMPTSEYQNYDVIKTETGVIVNIWNDEIAETAYKASYGNEEHYQKWQEIKKSTRSFYDSIEDTLDGKGMLEWLLEIDIVNEHNKSLIMLSTTNGAALYDCVEEARSK